MKTNRIIILVNELVETAEKQQKASIPLNSLFRSYKDSENYSLSYDDIFIANCAKWASIKDRLEEYAMLSHLREGKLELVYFSYFDEFERSLNSNYQDHLQLYDQSISLDKLEAVVSKFNYDFHFELIRLNSCSGIYPPTKEVVLRSIETSINRSHYIRTA